MPDSLLFDGTDDRRRFSPGNFAGTGAFTFACIVRPDTPSHYFWICTRNGDAGSPGGLLAIDNSSNFLIVYDGTERNSGPNSITPGATSWFLLATTKAAGTTTPRYHIYDYDAEAWTHGDYSGTIANLGSWSSIGIAESPIEYYAGNILIAAVWDSNVSESTLDTLTGAKGAWTAASPDEAWRFDTTSTITPFVGTGTQTLSTGATLDADAAPAGWTDGDPPPAYPVKTIDYSAFKIEKLRR
jgi:hypothetical protein